MKNIFLAVLIFIVVGNSFSQVTDKDGNTLHTVKIGNQEWTTGNLSVSHYRNGDAIPQVQDSKEWAKLTTGAWCYYEGDDNNNRIYGKLYNWYAVNDSRGLAPEGWHVSTDKEWTKLTDFLDGEKTAGEKLKSKEGWLENKLATNESGFSGLPGGMRDADGSFYDINKFGCYWTSTESSDIFAYYRFLIYNYTDVARFDGIKARGFSVRCVRD